MQELQNVVQDAAVKYAEDNGFSGLSHSGWFSFYVALQEAVEKEWRKAKSKPTNYRGSGRT